MSFTVKGMPTEISEYIELPNMAELLLYPQCMDVDIESFLKYATEFQKHLLSKVPLRNDKRFVSVLSQVRLLTPDLRSCTGFNQNNENPDSEWHIDHEDTDGGDDHVYQEEKDRVFLFTNQTSSMCQFGNKDIVLDDIHPHSVYQDFRRSFLANKDRLGWEGVDMPSNRIVTFTNHMHRATPSKFPEFKYMLRVVESDRKRMPTTYSPETHNIVTVFDGFRQQYVMNYERQVGKIVFHLPTLTKDSFWKPEDKDK